MLSVNQVSHALFVCDPMQICRNNFDCFAKYDCIGKGVVDHLQIESDIEVALRLELTRWFSEEKVASAYLKDVVQLLTENTTRETGIFDKL